MHTGIYLIFHNYAKKRLNIRTKVFWNIMFLWFSFPLKCTTLEPNISNSLGKKLLKKFQGLVIEQYYSGLQSEQLLTGIMRIESADCDINGDA